MSPDVAASIKARLLARAKLRGEEFELFLVRYACERFLYRLGASELRERCILKGAGLLTLWMDDPYRATRDLDLLAFGDNDPASIRTAMETICRVPCVEDGVTFDMDSLAVHPIRAEDECPGQRAILNAFLGSARIRMQVDFAFGDAVVPDPEESGYRTLIVGLLVPRIRAYPRVATVAEKFEAMIDLGQRNSRMKDFHDIWALSGHFDFEGAALREAIARCFARRGTSWSAEVPGPLGPRFYAAPELESRWQAYLRAGALRTPPPQAFGEIGERMQTFLLPIRNAIVREVPFVMDWPAGGAWQGAASEARTEDA